MIKILTVPAEDLQYCMNPSIELLSVEKILPWIERKNSSRLAKLELFDTIGSTNQYLLEHAASGPCGWVGFAEQQTAARGRRGRPWFSPYGASVICSILWRFSKERLDVSGLSIAVGVMVAMVLEKYGVMTGIELKWPNDVLFAGRKLVGILLERCQESIVIGIGINTNLPQPVEASRIDLAEILGRSISRNRLAGLLLNELLENLPCYEEKGLSAFIHEWRKRDFLAGKDVLIHTPKKVIPGKVQGINENGELLLLDQSQTLQRFCYGEVSVRPFQ
jgi:BirA family biotin operon repressor/biotin-[acetyl-CoA-carboxylase] ligase